MDLPSAEGRPRSGTAVLDAPIPFNRPSFAGPELDYVAEALALGWTAGDGVFTKRCQELLVAELGVPNALLTTSCTDALEMAAVLLRIEPGAEVIVPSFTFVSTINAFVLHGARPVFADIREDTLNLDETRLESLLTPKTAAILAVHYAGVGCEMDAIMALARDRGIAVVEDNAHGLFGAYKGRQLGTFGSLAALSFHETKNISCGEGGALLLNDTALVERAEIIREKGTNRSQFRRGQVDKYSWVDVGSSHLPSDLLAAILLAQLQARYDIQARRRTVWETYDAELREWAAAQGVALPAVPPHCAQPYHMYYVVAPTPEGRDRLIEHLQGRGIMSAFHYVPLHTSPMGRRFGGRPGDCPVTESVSARLLRLPFFTSMATAEQARVIQAVREFDFP